MSYQLAEDEWHGEINGRSAIAIPSQFWVIGEGPEKTRLQISLFVRAGSESPDSAIAVDLYEHDIKDRPRPDTVAELERILRGLGFRPHSEEATDGH